MTNVHEEIVRDGFHLTRQHWQHFDRLNATPEIHGMLVPVQGGRSGAPDSGSTHFKLGVVDYRRWNLNDTQAFWVVRHGRNQGGATHERFPWQGFDSHFHECLLGDDIVGVMDLVAIQQCMSYKMGGDGVAGTTGDVNPYRPNPIRNYQYQEDDRMDAKQAEELFRIGNKLDAFVEGELNRDAAEAARDKRRFTEVITMLGKEVDFNRRILPHIQDAATRKQVKKRIEEVMLYLKNNPDVKGVDNPDDKQMP